MILATAMAMLPMLHAPLTSHLGCACSVLAAMPLQAQPMKNWPNNKAWESEAGETHLKNIKQLTFGGQNAEAYFDLSGKKITYQSRQQGYPDEQIFTMNIDGSGKKLISTGKGRTTCSYISPDGKWLYFSSTHATQPEGQPPVDMSKGYAWMVNPNFRLYRSRLDGSQLQTVLSKPGYIAETTIAPNGKFMTWTGNFEGDVDIYRSDLDGKNIKRLTNEVGYDGGPFVSYDSKVIVYRRSAPFANENEVKAYQDLLKQNLVRPNKMDLWVMDANGNYERPITNLGGASFAPFLHPNGKTIIFSSNHHDPRGREFDLFVINKDGTDLRQITFSPEFDGFPMFSRDGRKLVFASNRNGKVRGETNIFVADWVD